MALASLFAPIQAAWTLLAVPLHASGFVARHLAGFAGALVESVSLLFHGWGETDEAAPCGRCGEEGRRGIQETTRARGGEP